ncbi:PKD domain-containing protein [candidate division KSB1 bacterium]|nr:PKD domain-containing protein [candidate division KSB1 bacterium]
MYSRFKLSTIVFLSMILIFQMVLFEYTSLQAAPVDKQEQWANLWDEWITGINTPPKGSYQEDDVIPYRFYMNTLTTGSHTLTIEYESTKAGVHAFDYLMTYNATETPSIGDDITNFPWAGPSTYAIPLDPNVSGAGVTQQPGNFTIYNGTITAVSSYTLLGTYLGDSNTQITITFEAASEEVLIVWGGHIASEDDWGDGYGAGGVTGAPFHMKLAALDGASIGERHLQVRVEESTEEGIEISAMKTANAELKRTYEWTIEKTVFPDKWDLFKGDTGTSLYKIVVTKSVASDVITVSGKICVENLDDELPTEGLKIVDELKYKTGTMDWETVPGATETIIPDEQIPAGETVCYYYSFTFDAIKDAEYMNVATVTITNYDGYLGEEHDVEAMYQIGTITTPTSEILGSVNVEDTNGKSWKFEESGSVTYEKIFDCDDAGVNENTATILETEQYSTASVTVNCYSLDIKKDAKTSFKRSYSWTIDKWAEYAVLDLKGCVATEVPYKVLVEATYIDEDFKVCGTIYIHNPAPMPAIINKIEDVIVGALTVELEDDALTFPYTLEPDGTLEIKYCATLPDAETRKNVATAYLQNYDYEYLREQLISTPTGETKFSASVEFVFDKPEEVDECVKVTDTNFTDPLAEKLCVVDAPKTFEYVLPFGPYYSTGTVTHDNTAKFVTCDTKTEGSDSWKLTINVKCEPAVADFTAEPTSGISPLEVQFTDLSTNAARWLWEFGDGTTSEEQHPVHVFKNPPHKYYTVKLTVWDCCEEYTDSITKENFIQVIRPTTVGFSAFPIVGTPELEVQFYNLSGGVTTHWVWTYGDGAVDEFQHGVMSMINPLHVYTEEGSYSVCLEGSGQGGYDKMCVNDLIYVDEDYAAIELVEGGMTLAGEDWNDAIDHDVIPPDASVVAINGDAWAIFKFAGSETRMIDKIRILSNDVFESRFKNHLTKDFQLWVSEDGVNFTPGFVGTLSFLSTWETFEFAPVKATYLKLVLVNARGAASPYASICEFQVFGKVATTNTKDMMAFTMAEEHEVIALPTDYGLSQNYPNPFNPETSINYQLPEDADIRLDIYNVRGELVTTLVNSRMSAGYHQAIWNATDRFGNAVSGGMYFYSIQIASENAGKQLFTRKMILLK